MDQSKRMKLRSRNFHCRVANDSSFLMVFTAIFQREHIARAPNEREKYAFSANKSPYLRKGARCAQVYYDVLTGSRICAFDWYQNHRPWMTLNDRYTDLVSCVLGCRALTFALAALSSYGCRSGEIKMNKIRRKYLVREKET